VRLDLAHEHFLGAAVHDQVDHVSPSDLRTPLELERSRTRGWLGVVPVDDRGELALAVKTAGALAEQSRWRL